VPKAITKRESFQVVETSLKYSMSAFFSYNLEKYTKITITPGSRQEMSA
jgi:hypothetical protein